MKVLFVGDGSNMHNCLAHELRRQGHEAVVASSGSRWMQAGRDINLYRHKGFWGAVRYVADIVRALPQMRGYDIVHIGGHIFLELRPEKVRWVFDYLRRHNRHVLLSAMGTDCLYYKMCHDGHSFRYSDYMVGDRPSPYVGSPEYYAQEQDNWRSAVMQSHCDHIVSHIEGAVACLWEYYVPYLPILGDRVCYAGIPIDTEALSYREWEGTPERVRLMIGIQSDRSAVKGSDRLLASMRRVHDRYPTLCELDVVEDMPMAEYGRHMRESHVLVDQLYSYTPATNALMAMSQGLVAVSGAEPEYYDLIGERENHPIINVTPYDDADIDARLEWIVTHREELPSLSRASRAFVEKHNAASVVAGRYLDFWHRLFPELE